MGGPKKDGSGRKWRWQGEQSKGDNCEFSLYDVKLTHATYRYTEPMFSGTAPILTNIDEYKYVRCRLREYDKTVDHAGDYFVDAPNDEPWLGPDNEEKDDDIEDTSLWHSDTLIEHCSNPEKAQLDMRCCHIYAGGDASMCVFVQAAELRPKVTIRLHKLHIKTWKAENSAIMCYSSEGANSGEPVDLRFAFRGQKFTVW